MIDNGASDTKRRRKLKEELAGCLILTLVMTALVYVALYTADWFDVYDHWCLLRGAQVGMSRAEVVKRLGPPEHIAHSRAEFEPTEAYEPTPTHPVEKEVLEYYKGALMIYVYIGRNDRVTHVFPART